MRNLRRRIPAFKFSLSALVLTLATIALLVRVTGRIYANAVMRIGARVRLRDALAR